MALAMAGFVTNDALMKRVAEDISMNQAIVLRGLFGTIWIFFIAWHFGALRPIRTAAGILPIARTMGEVLGTVFFLTALTQIDLANASAILQALPLSITLGGALFLGEAVGWRRLSAILFGFFGVILIIRPGLSGFSAYSILIVFAVLSATTRDLCTRAMGRDIPSLFLSMLAAPAVALAGLAMCAYEGRWDPITWPHFAMLLGASIFMLVGYQFIVLAMREGDIPVVTPFRYTSLLWAVILGMIIFGEFPDVLTIIGGAIIVASGLYTLYREQVVLKRKPKEVDACPDF
jgi:drug/metabolite transporter (DMT)-like permease